MTLMFYAALELLAYATIVLVGFALAFLLLAIIAAARAAGRYDDETGMDGLHGDFPHVPADHDDKHAA